MTTIKGILKKNNLNLPITNEMKNIEIPDWDFIYVPEKSTDEEYVFFGKISRKWITINLKELTVEHDITPPDDEFATWTLYDEKGEIIEIN